MMLWSPNLTWWSSSKTKYCVVWSQHKRDYKPSMLLKSTESDYGFANFLGQQQDNCSLSDYHLASTMTALGLLFLILPSPSTRDSRSLHACWIFLKCFSACFYHAPSSSLAPVLRDILYILSRYNNGLFQILTAVWYYINSNSKSKKLFYCILGSGGSWFQPQVINLGFENNLFNVKYSGSSQDTSTI